MTALELLDLLMAQNIMQWNGIVEVVDWGPRARGQGKRVKGMIRGSMSDAPTGKKAYYSLIAKLPDRQDHLRDLRTFGTWGNGKQQAYVRARAAGYGHDAAYLFACGNGSLAAARAVLNQYGAPRKQVVV